MKKLEYNVLAIPLEGLLGKRVPSGLGETLNAAGADGWELCSSCASSVLGGESQALILFFQREIE